MRRSLALLTLAAAVLAGAGTTALHATDGPALVAEDGAAGDKPCGQGNLTVCGKTITYRCVEWRTTSVQLGGTLSPGGGGATAGHTLTCARSETRELLLFKNP